jgi:hypothetical protein
LHNFLNKTNGQSCRKKSMTTSILKRKKYYGCLNVAEGDMVVVTFTITGCPKVPTKLGIDLNNGSVDFVRG